MQVFVAHTAGKQSGRERFSEVVIATHVHVHGRLTLRGGRNIGRSLSQRRRAVGGSIGTVAAPTPPCGDTNHSAMNEPRL